MAMTDRLKLAQDRYSDIKLEWNLGGDPGDVNARLEAVIAWLDGGVKVPEVAIRATQILLLDPERPGVGRRPVLKRVFKELGSAWLSARGDEFHLLQAMILAARPERCEGGFGLVGLMGAAWEVMRGRAVLLSHVQDWHHGPMNQGSQLMIEEAQLTEPQKPTAKVKPPLSAGHHLLASVNANLQTHLSSLQQAVEVALAHVAPTQGNNAEFRRGVAEAAKHTFHILQAAFRTPNVGTSPIDTILGIVAQPGPVIKAILAVEEVVKGVTDRVQTAEARIGTLDQFKDALIRGDRAVYPAELELLWWGQARYCHTFHTPFRRLLKDPTQKTRACYAAIAEAADRAQRLDPEPSAAFLVETLASLGLDVDERRPVHSWLQDLCLHADPKDAPTGPLAELAGEDATGMPVTWARLHARAPFDEETASTALAMPLDAEIDLGDWATWILRERVLDLRMRA